MRESGHSERMSEVTRITPELDHDHANARQETHFTLVLAPQVGNLVLDPWKGVLSLERPRVRQLVWSGDKQTGNRGQSGHGQ
jgi:hypothetical protein